MARLNLTLDRDTYSELNERAKRAQKPTAKVAKELLVEGLARHSALEHRRRLARDYTEGRSDAHSLLNDLEAAQLDLLRDESD